MVEKKYKRQQLLLILNQSLILLFLVYEYLYENEIKTAETMQMVIITAIALEGIHIGKINFKCNSMMNHFHYLLILVSWYFLLSLDESKHIGNMSGIMLPITFYFLLRFILIFFFQGTSYKYKKITNIILLMNCVANLAAKTIDNRLFNLLFLYQFVAGLLISGFLFIVHRKRIAFVLKSGWINIRFSLLFCLSIFIIYIYVFNREAEYIDNLGAYFLIFIALLIVHCITFNKRVKKKNTLLLSQGKKYLLLVTIVCVGGILFFVLAKTMVAAFIIVHCFLLCYIVINFIMLDNENDDLFSNQKLFERYQMSIRQIKREEALKNDFSNFLHDDILQDILAAKNLVYKAGDENVKIVIAQIFEKLNCLIREQMNTYHPQILKSLTLKENLESLICSLLEVFSTNMVDVKFECDDKFFLVDPYHIVLYRIFKELLTNALKHSNCTQINIKLFQKVEKVTLVIQDDGVGITDMKLNKEKHNGLNSIKEQLEFIDGQLEMESEKQKGTKISLSFVMKGEESYAYFIDR